MKLPIQQKLEKINKIEISLGAFTAIGLPLLAYPVLGLAGTSLAIFSIPLLISAALQRKGLSGGNYLSHEGLFSSMYKKTFKNWFYKYLDDSENLTEKKYKILFTSMWAYSNNIKLESLISKSENKLDELSNQLFSQKETQYFIDYIFYGDTANDKSIPNGDFKDYFNEDKNNNQKMMIAQKVYKDFENLGMVGKNIQSFIIGPVPALLKLQEYKLTQEDFREIKEYTRKAKNNKYDEKNSTMASIEAFRIGSIITVNNGFENDFKEILNNCDTKQEILILGNLLNKVRLENIFNPNVDNLKNKLLEEINQYLENFNLANKLEKIVPQNNISKKPKKKI